MSVILLLVGVMIGLYLEHHYAIYDNVVAFLADLLKRNG